LTCQLADLHTCKLLSESRKDIIGSELVNFPVDLIKQLYVKHLGVVAFDGDTETVGVDIVDEYVTEPSKDSQHIFSLLFFKIDPVVLHMRVFRSNTGI
jgi:hypothetical protein